MFRANKLVPFFCLFEVSVSMLWSWNAKFDMALISDWEKKVYLSQLEKCTFKDSALLILDLISNWLTCKTAL